MEGPSNQRSDGNQAVSKFLTNLPSRGCFSSTVLSSNPGGMRVYVCEHDTSPPDDQQIKTNQANILIRSLLLRKQRGELSTKGTKSASTAEGSRKRASERLLESGASTKRPTSQTSSGQEGTSTQIPERDLHSLTVERLRALLKEKGLSTRGKKDELIARLKGL